LNVHAITHMLQAFLPAMIAQGGGAIVNMAPAPSRLGDWTVPGQIALQRMPWPT
jgi:short-subunit dehydrogenase